MPRKNKPKVVVPAKAWSIHLRQLPDSADLPRAHLSVCTTTGAEFDVIEQAVGEEDALLPQAPELVSAALKTQAGLGRIPLQTTNEPLAHVLKDAAPSVDVVLVKEHHGDTFLDDSLAQLMPPSDRSFLDSKAKVEEVGAFFVAARDFLRKRWWKNIPGLWLFHMRSDELFIDVAAALFVSKDKSPPALIIANDPEALFAAMELSESGHVLPDVPHHITCTFGPKDDVSARRLHEISDHQWPLANAKSIPTLTAYEGDGEVEIERDDILFFQCAFGVLSSLAPFKEKLQEVLVAFNADEGDDADTVSFKTTLHLDTIDGEADVEFCAPFPDSSSDLDSADLESADLDSADLAQPQRALDALYTRNPDAFDHPSRFPLEDALVKAFAFSKEAEDLDVRILYPVMDLVAGYENQSLTTVAPSTLRDVLLHLVPRKISLDPSDADSLIACLRAFYRFVEREYGFSRSAKYLRVLEPALTRVLKHNLADQSQFGLAKTIITAAAEMGYDITSPTDIEAFMAATASAGQSVVFDDVGRAQTDPPPANVLPFPTRKKPDKK